MEDSGLISQNSFTTEGRRGLHKYEFISQSLNLKIVDQESGYSRITRVKTRLIKNWRKSPFVAPCPKGCDNYSSGGIVNCKNRDGLVGRNVLSETGLTIVLNGKSGRTSVKKASK